MNTDAYSDVAPCLFVLRLAYGAEAEHVCDRDASQKQTACLACTRPWLLSPILRTNRTDTLGVRKQGWKCGQAWWPAPLTST